MEVLFTILVVLMLLLVGYAQWQRGVARTVGNLEVDDEEASRT